MSTNKNAIIRYQALDKCFSNLGRKYFIDDLLMSCNEALWEYDPGCAGIKRRQLFEDIKFMESSQGWSIPLERISDGKKVYYKYEDKKFSINNRPLNETEINHLKSALLILSRFKGMPQFEWLNEIFAKFSKNNTSDKNLDEIISFDSNPYLTGIGYLGDLFNSIIYKKVLEISYTPFKTNKTKKFNIHPYFLKQYNNRWFLFGLLDETKDILNLAIDRISGIKELSKTIYSEEFAINATDYFEDIIGVTKPATCESIKISIWFSPERAPYITTKPIHGSQKTIINNRDGLEIMLDIIPNPELDSLILSFGNDAKVISPASYKDIIKKKIKESLLLYK